MRDVGRFYSYHHIKSMVFTIVAGIGYLVACVFVFDLGLLGARVELDLSTQMLTILLTDPTLYIPIIVLSGLFIYNFLKNKKIDTVAIMDKQYELIIVPIALLIGVALIVYGYIDTSARGPLWVMLGVILDGAILIQLLSFKLFKLNSNNTKEDYKK